MRPVPLFAQGQIIARGFERQGMKTAPLPLAVTTSNYNGRGVMPAVRSVRSPIL
jgi:hypothetical protein